jgi:dihydrofolate reductase
MNQTPKVVLPRTLKEAPCGRHQPATTIENHVEEKIRELKEKPGKNIIIYGAANAVQNLSRIGLIDEYQLLVHQVFLGSGTPLFSGIWRQMSLKLLRTGTYRNGVSVLCYQPRSQSRVAG